MAALFVAYDTAGDLFVNGYDRPNGTLTIEVAKLTAGGTNFESVSLDKPLRGNTAFPAGLQWYNGDLVIAHLGPPVYGCCGRVYRFTIKGTLGTHAGSYLARSDLADFFIYNSTIATTDGYGHVFL